MLHAAVVDTLDRIDNSRHLAAAILDRLVPEEDTPGHAEPATLAEPGTIELARLGVIRGTALVDMLRAIAERVGVNLDKVEATRSHPYAQGVETGWAVTPAQLADWAAHGGTGLPPRGVDLDDTPGVRYPLG